MNSPDKMTSKFLAFDEFHIVEIQGLDDSSIRGAAKRVLKDRTEIKHTTVLNFICRSLGLKGGYAEHKRSHWPAVNAFVEKNNLLRPGLNQNGQRESLLSISIQSIAERCFLSSRPLPKRIFMGAGVTWDDVILAASQLPDVHLDAPFLGSSLDSRNCADVLGHFPPGPVQIISNGHRFFRSDFIHLGNLLGDQLIRYHDEFAFALHPISTIYLPAELSDEEVEQGRAKNAEAAMLFARIIKSSETGWIDVLPFNNDLVFLKDQSGGYDYVFRGQKGNGFNHNIHAHFLKNSDIPKSDDLYHFQRWLYFQSKNWQHLDRHHAEAEYYRKGGTNWEYPGQDEVLRRYLIGEGRYRPPLKKAPLVSGFKKVFASGRWLAVSELVTVKQFRDFMLNTNQLYAGYRPKPPQQDSWNGCNGPEISAEAPAAVTWYDAQAYATTVAKTQHLPVRLATEDEWLDIANELREGISGDPASTLRARSESQVERTEIAPGGYLGTSLARGGSNLTLRRTQDGVGFVPAIDLGEWLAPKGAAINSLHLGAMNSAPVHLTETRSVASEQIDEAGVDWSRRVSATRERMPPTSSGAYKGTRVGFRMVYELEI